MRVLTLLYVLVCACAAAQTNQTGEPVGDHVNSLAANKPLACLIVKHKGTLGRRLTWMALTGLPIAPGSKFDLVDSVNYRPGAVAFTGKALQQVQLSGVKVVILEQKYQLADLEDARKSCADATK